MIKRAFYCTTRKREKPLILLMVLSYFSSGAIVQEASNLLFSQAAETHPIPEIDPTDDGQNIWTSRANTSPTTPLI